MEDYLVIIQVGLVSFVIGIAILAIRDMLMSNQQNYIGYGMAIGAVVGIAQAVSINVVIRALGKADTLHAGMELINILIMGFAGAIAGVVFGGCLWVIFKQCKDAFSFKTLFFWTVGLSIPPAFIFTYLNFGRNLSFDFFSAFSPEILSFLAGLIVALIMRKRHSIQCVQAAIDN